MSPGLPSIKRERPRPAHPSFLPFGNGVALQPAPPKKKNVTPESSPPAFSRYRWVICSLLFLATAINYIDRQILSLVKETLDNQLHWTNGQFGLVNSAFQAAYALGLFFFGWFIDKYGTRIGYTLSIAAWSTAALGHALVSSIGGFFAARVALGLGEGGNFPAAIKAIAQWFPQSERAFATSLFNCGSNFGALLAPALVPAIVDRFGWHGPFVLAGLAGYAWLALWWPLFHTPAHSPHVSPRELAGIRTHQPAMPAPEKVSWRIVLRHRQAWSFIIAKFFTDPVWWFFLIWLPDFFKRTRGLDIKHSWVLLVSIYGIVTVLSIAGGWLTGYLTTRGWSVTRARKTGLFLFAMLVTPIALATRVENLAVVLILGLAGAAHQAWSANLYTTVSDMFPKGAVATLTGLGGVAGSLGGIAFPYLTGLILDHYPRSGYTILFAFCSLAYLLAFGLNHLLAPRYEPVGAL